MGLRHANAPKGRIDEEAICRDPVGDLPRVIVEHVGCEDLVVVERRMREGSTAVDVADSPNSGHVRLQRVVDDDIAAFVGFDAGGFYAQVIRVGPAANGHQEVGADDFLDARFAVRGYGDAARTLGQGDTFGVEPNIDIFVFQDFPHGVGNVVILATDQLGTHLDDRHFTAEAPIHLREFKPDVTAADYDEMLRQEVDIHNAGVCQIVDIADPGHVGNDGTSANIEYDFLSLQYIAVDAARYQLLPDDRGPYRRSGSPCPPANSSRRRSTA